MEDPVGGGLAAYACPDGVPRHIGGGGHVSLSVLAGVRGVTGGASGVLRADHATPPVSPPTSGRRT
eukprot:1185643-Prorocentrum_minimum.AAC.1